MFIDPRRIKFRFSVFDWYKMIATDSVISAIETVMYFNNFIFIQQTFQPSSIVSSDVWKKVY